MKAFGLLWYHVFLVSQPIPTEQNFLIFIKDHIDIHECLTVIVKPKLHRSAFYTIMATGSIVLEGFKVSDSKLWNLDFEKNCCWHWTLLITPSNSIVERCKTKEKSLSLRSQVIIILLWLLVSNLYRGYHH